MFVDLKPDPVDILGIAKIVRSPSDSSNGPWFYVDARQSPPYIEVSLFTICYCKGYLTSLLPCFSKFRNREESLGTSAITTATRTKRHFQFLSILLFSITKWTKYPKTEVTQTEMKKERFAVVSLPFR